MYKNTAAYREHTIPVDVENKLVIAGGDRRAYCVHVSEADPVSD